MKVESIQFTVEEIFEMKGRIDPKPQYQRTPVWKIDRKRLLIDSILRGYDLPKFYLNKISGNAFYDFEVCDGQQRLRTIWEFYEDKFSLGKNVSFEGTSLDGKKYSELNIDTKTFFKSFTLTIAQIIEANHSEIRDLFARLQKGMGLNQAELRRALSTHIGSYVESIVDNHNFFKKRLDKILESTQSIMPEVLPTSSSFRLSPLIQITLISLYLALTIPLPFLAEFTHSPISPLVLWVGIAIGLIILIAFLSEKVVLDDAKIED